MAAYINIKLGNTRIESNSGSYDFGTVALGSHTQYIIFTIENIGTSTLIISSTGLTGTSTGSFSLYTGSTNFTLLGGHKTTFEIRYTASYLGEVSARVHFFSNDVLNSDYNFEITGTGAVPQLDVVFNGDYIPYDGTIDLGQELLLSDTLDFTRIGIENSSGMTLNIVYIKLDGIYNSEYELDLTSTGMTSTGLNLVDGESTSFGIKPVPRGVHGKRFVYLYIRTGSFYYRCSFIYNVLFEDSTLGEFSYYPMDNVKIENVYPYVRSVAYSSSSLLSNPYWVNLKKVLIDSSYYDKDPWAIPYSKNEDYGIKGYVGLKDCKIDIFINDILKETLYSDENGDFTINYNFPLSDTYLRIQARDKNNFAFSRMSAPIRIRPLNLYTFYSVYGYQYADIETEIANSKLDLSIETCRYSTFIDRFNPLTGLVKNGSESESSFSGIAREIFQSFEFVGYDKSLIMFLDALVANVENFDHYEIFYNNELNTTIQTGKSFATTDFMEAQDYVIVTTTGLVVTPDGYVIVNVTTSTGLERDKYYYGLSSIDADGMESDIATLMVDTRWWPATFKGFVILTWDSVPSSNSAYRIYRGSTGDTLEFLLETKTNIFVDVGKVLPSYSPLVPIYGYSSGNVPENFRVLYRNGVGKDELYFREANWLNIVIFAKDDTLLPDYILDRLKIYLKKFIPPEMKYTVHYANDSFARVSDSQSLIEGYSILSSPTFVNCAGDIFTSIVLSGSGTPSSPAATYISSVFKKMTFFHTLTFIGSGSLTYQYRTSEDNLIWTDWSNEVSATGAVTIAFLLNIRYIELKWLFYSTSYSDSDNFHIVEIT